MKKKGATVVIILIIASTIGAIGLVGYKTYRLEQKAVEQARVEQAAVEKAEREKRAAEQAAELAKIQKLATIARGEGVEHSLIRQLVYNPDIMNWVKVNIGGKEYDLTYPGDNSDKKAVKKWAGRTAHLLAIFAGYVELKTGQQIRVKKPGEVAYVLDFYQPTKRWSVDIYKKEVKAASFGGEPRIFGTYWLGVDRSGIFRADVENGVAFFEYVWTPAFNKGKKQRK